MHAEKYTKTQVGQLQKHYERDLERNYSNQEIDKSKSHMNYNLAPDRGDVSQYLNDRLDEVKHINRKDINVMVDWIVTLPKDYKGDKDQFFQESYNILSERYGEKNVLSAYVHKDETQDHMHFSFMPVVRDKDGSERLCAKETISRGELKFIHPYMEKELTKRLHEPVHMMNGSTAGGNKTILELKNQELEKQVAEQQRELEAAREAYNTVNKELQQNRQELEKIKSMPYNLPEPKKIMGIEYYPVKQYQQTLMQAHAYKLDSDKQAESIKQERDTYKTALGASEAEKDRLRDNLHQLQEKQWDKGYIEHQRQEINRMEREHQQQPEHQHNRSHDIDR